MKTAEPLKKVPFKLWLCAEAERLRLRPNSLFMRISRGRHPAPPKRRENARVVFVLLPTSQAKKLLPPPTEVNRAEILMNKILARVRNCECGAVAVTRNNAKCWVCLNCKTLEYRRAEKLVPQEEMDFEPLLA